MDNEKYKAIAPFEGEDAIKAAAYIKDNPIFLEHTLKGLYRAALRKRSDSEFIKGFKRDDDVVRNFYYLLGSVESWRDFQRTLVTNLIMPLVIEGSTDGFYVKGLEKLDLSRSHVFISNHRDIILDSAFLVHSLMSKNGQCVKAAAGSNLYMNKQASAYFGLLGCVKVFRGLNLREEYEASLNLSSYIFDTIREGKDSVWIAGNAGRSKDGVDRVVPAIIKMMVLSKRKDGDFPSLLKELSIIPVSISYEKNPNDVSMAKEILLSLLHGSYKKKPLDDLMSITRGISKPKGRVTITFGEEITSDFEKPDDAALEIEKRIRLNYTLYPFDYYAYDKVNKTDRFKSKYTSLESQEDEKRFKTQKLAVSSQVLKSYAAPVESKLIYGDIE